MVSGTVTLPAGNYVASSFNMNGGATLKVSGGIAQIWVTGGLILTGSANAGGDPTNLEFLVTGNQGVNVNSNTDVHRASSMPERIGDAGCGGDRFGRRQHDDAQQRLAYRDGSCPRPSAPLRPAGAATRQPCAERAPAAAAKPLHETRPGGGFSVRGRSMALR